MEWLQKTVLAGESMESMYNELEGEEANVVECGVSVEDGCNKSLTAWNEAVVGNLIVDISVAMMAYQEAHELDVMPLDGYNNVTNLRHFDAKIMDTILEEVNEGTGGSVEALREIQRERDAEDRAWRSSTEFEETESTFPLSQSLLEDRVELDCSRERAQSAEKAGLHVLFGDPDLEQGNDARKGLQRGFTFPFQHVQVFLGLVEGHEQAGEFPFSLRDENTSNVGEEIATNGQEPGVTEETVSAEYNDDEDEEEEQDEDGLYGLSLTANRPGYNWNRPELRVNLSSQGVDSTTSGPDFEMVRRSPPVLQYQRELSRELISRSPSGSAVSQPQTVAQSEKHIELNDARQRNEYASNHSISHSPEEVVSPNETSTTPMAAHTSSDSSHLLQRNPVNARSHAQDIKRRSRSESGSILPIPYSRRDHGEVISTRSDCSYEEPVRRTLQHSNRMAGPTRGTTHLPEQSSQALQISAHPRQTSQPSQRRQSDPGIELTTFTAVAPPNTPENELQSQTTLCGTFSDRSSRPTCFGHVCSLRCIIGFLIVIGIMVAGICVSAVELVKKRHIGVVSL
jgi:hypothetical protein